MKTATTFRDPQAIAKKHCDALLAAASQPFLVGLGVGTKLPAVAPQGRLLVVRSSGWVEYQPPTTAVALIRVVAWDPDEDVAWDLASWFHGQLLALPGDLDVISYRYDSGPRKATDPDYDSPIASFTIRCRIRPAIL